MARLTRAELQLLGPADYLGSDLYTVDWGEIDAPEVIETGAEIEIAIRLTNASAVTWRARGAAQVRLAYHWLDPDGRPVIEEGLRTPLREAVSPGATLTQKQRVRAPEQPGSYLLELDPVLEHIAWFSQRNGGNTRRLPIEVRPPELRLAEPER